MKNTPENNEKKVIKDYLDIKGIFHFPIMQGLGSAKGLPDRFAIRKGKVYAIEIKSGIGKQSEWQKWFQLNWEAEGGIYILGGIDEVMKIIK